MRPQCASAAPSVKVPPPPARFFQPETYVQPSQCREVAMQRPFAAVAMADTPGKRTASWAPKTTFVQMNRASKGPPVLEKRDSGFGEDPIYETIDDVFGDDQVAAVRAW